jgi:hypothetical protein
MPARWARGPAPALASPTGMKTQAMSERKSRSFRDEAASIIARCRPEYSSTIASWTMVSSRWVAGLSTGMRAFSAMATMTSAISARPSETRRPTSGEPMKAAMVESWEEPATRARVKMMSSMAGSAKDEIITSRLEPMPPKLVPVSMPAKARKKRALARSAMMAIRSAVQLKTRPVAKVGTRAAATQVAAKIR